MLGVKEDGRSFEIIGVIDVDKIQGDFFSLLNSRDKLSVAATTFMGRCWRLTKRHVLVFCDSGGGTEAQASLSGQGHPQEFHPQRIR